MERKIGEIFEYDGEWYQVEKSNDECCTGCGFYEIGCKAKYADVGSCGTSREDLTQVIFKKLEKVGVPMKIHNRLVLKVKADAYKCIRCCFYSKAKCELTIQECKCYDCGEGTKFIEIKENKEDMEEKKLNLKPFDIQKAREGKPVCTRDGRKARIVCFDGKGDQPIIALVEAKGNKDALIEKVERYFINGHSVFEVRETNDDLMMLPEKKEGWVNIVRGNDGKSHMGRGIFQSKEEAENAIKAFSDNLIDTVKINWSE